MSEPEICRIVVEGANVHNLRAGNEDSAPVVLLHGASFSSQTWLELGTIRFFETHGCMVHAVDLPGFGKSAANPNASPNWLGALFDALGIRAPAVVVSPSMSGRFSLPFVAEQPARVRGLIAVAPVGISIYEAALRNAPTPILAVWGEHDRLISLQQADALIRVPGRDRKVVIAGGGHAPYMNHPAAFHAEALAFLAQLSVCPPPPTPA